MKRFSRVHAALIYLLYGLPLHVLITVMLKKTNHHAPPLMPLAVPLTVKVHRTKKIIKRLSLLLSLCRHQRNSLLPESVRSTSLMLHPFHRNRMQRKGRPPRSDLIPHSFPLRQILKGWQTQRGSQFRTESVRPNTSGRRRWNQTIGGYW